MASSTSSGSAGACGSPIACCNASAPTCGPLPWVSTTSSARPIRAIARAASRAWTVCSGHVPRSSSRIRALPPNAMTRRAIRPLPLRAADRQPDRPRRAIGRVAPGVRMGGAEVDRVALLEVVLLTVDVEAHLALEEHDELLPGMHHRLGPAVGAGVDERLRAGGEERPVAAGDVLQL